MQTSKPVKYTLLVVDDNPDMVEFLEDVLSERHNIVTALDGAAAIDLIERTAIDLIVSDVMMPLVDGFELCRHVKGNVLLQHIPFIMLTAKNTLGSKIQGLEHGADVYLEKPFLPDLLVAQINSLLRNRQNIRVHYNRSPQRSSATAQTNRNEKGFLIKLNLFILENIAVRSLCVDELAAYMNMSRPTLYRKIRLLSNLSPNELINMTRLNKAAELLRQTQFKIYEISTMVGFSTSSHFVRNFIRNFHVSPKTYRNDHHAAQNQSLTGTNS
ncbi:response regulator transcription factor [Sphingobacterium griseoflavum]|uniref:Chemotaxis protein CheY n=1 Tax=Sphingobacterium griseoflavum TaxID=1474952 RepID=A0ABQ3HTQ6_9SPHI|nr:response regulator [Sphingobacterium griseoflavum]GHE33845.1 hypothetical protein GCM10017764_16380 [Sphingobacterium griseoflavum]